MEQLRLGLPPRDTGNPFARLLFGLLALVAGLGLVALLLFVVLPVAGLIVSAALGGVLLAVAGVVMMVPFLLVAGSLLIFFSRSSARRQAGIRSNSTRH